MDKEAKTHFPKKNHLMKDKKGKEKEKEEWGRQGEPGKSIPGLPPQLDEYIFCFFKHTYMLVM